MEKEDVIKQISDEDYEKLQRLKKVASRSFTSLTPARKDKYYIQSKYTVRSYLHLDDTIRSLLNVCILSLEAHSEINNQYHDIYEMPKQVGTVLKVARGLLPSGEMEYLDEMRDLLFAVDEFPFDEDY